MSNSEYILTIGLEVHAELATKSKMWCGCKNDPDEKRPNANICPVCMAHPGTLPVINKEAVKKVLQVGTALGGTLADFTEFDRKNYFYPDIPKGYQLSQYKFPLVTGGELAGVKLTRIHLEEDTGTSKHDQGDFSLVDYNRAGVPLMELVTEPVIHDALTASKFAKELQLLLQYLGAGEANMEKGEMRVEANISVSKDSNKLGTKVEVKNLNSFKAVEKAIEYEMKRHIEILEKGEEVKQETRGWDENKQITFAQRSKENAHDYRYFPDPDLPKLKLADIPEFSSDELKKSLPELPWEKRERYINILKLSPQHAAFFSGDLKAANYFDEIAKLLPDAESILLASNYVAVDLAGLSKKEGFLRFPKPKEISELISLIKDKKISSRGAKDLLQHLVWIHDNDRSIESIAEEKGLILKNDPEEIKNIMRQVIESYENVVTDYKNGKTASLQFLIGQGMKLTGGSASPELVKKLLIELL